MSGEGMKMNDLCMPLPFSVCGGVGVVVLLFVDESSEEDVLFGEEEDVLFGEAESGQRANR